MKTSNIFWNRVLDLTEIGDDASLAEFRSALLGIDEGFSGLIDPADSYPEYVTISLCRHMYRVMGNLSDEKVAKHDGELLIKDD